MEIGQRVNHVNTMGNKLLGRMAKSISNSNPKLVKKSHPQNIPEGNLTIKILARSFRQLIIMGFT